MPPEGAGARAGRGRARAAALGGRRPPPPRPTRSAPSGRAPPRALGARRGPRVHPLPPTPLWRRNPRRHALQHLLELAAPDLVDGDDVPRVVLTVAEVAHRPERTVHHEPGRERGLDLLRVRA